MKLTKRLIPAFAMLLVSAVLMSTASFAWFSMNDNVSVSNITVTAKSDTVFIQISGDGGSTWDVKYDATVTAKLYPAALKTVADPDSTYLSTPSNWYYNYSKSSSDHTGVVGGEKYLDSFAEYVEILNYKVKNNSESKAANLHISALTVKENIGLEMYFVCTDENGDELNVVKVDEKTPVGESLLLAAELDAKEIVDVTVYVYINGENANVKSDNYIKGDLTGGLGFTFTAKEPTTNP